MFIRKHRLTVNDYLYLTINQKILGYQLLQTKFSNVKNCVLFGTFMIISLRSLTAKEIYVDSQMGIITSTASRGQASFREDAAQLQLMKTSSEDDFNQIGILLTSISLQNLTDGDDDNLAMKKCSSESVGGILMPLSQFYVYPG